MADYYPLIARAISGLDPGAPGEARRALYERARTALIAQLRSVQPPLTESEITRERLALEEAVRKVESEAAQRSRVEPAKPDASARARPGDALRTSLRSRATPTDPNPAPRPARPERPPLGQDEPRSPRNLRGEPPQSPPSDSEPPRRETSRPQPPVQGQGQGTNHGSNQGPNQGSNQGSGQGTPPRPAGPGMRGFRDVVADADDLGAAAAQASRAARRTYANVPSPSPEFDRIEPDMDNRADPMAEAPHGYDQPVDAPYQDAGAFPGRPKPGVKPGAKVGPRAGKPPKPPKAPKPPRVPSRFPLASAAILGAVVVLAGAGLLLGPKLWPSIKGLLKSQPVAEAPKTPATDSGLRPKITDRIGQPGSSQVAPVAQKAVLYEQDASDPQGKRFDGTVVWRTDQIAGANGQPPELAVRADVEIPDRKLKMTLTIRRNTDPSLPASHTAELTFTLPPDFSGGSIFNVPGMYVKSPEQLRGTPIAGIAVKVTDGFFLIGMSNVDADKSRNVQLLKDKSWLDIPLIYNNQSRAILEIEKGSPGERAFNDAFAAWGE